MQLTIGVTTSPRPTRYLVPTLQSIKAAAHVPYRVFVSPNFRDRGEDWDAVRALLGKDGRLLAPLVDCEIGEFVASRPDLASYADNPTASEFTHRGLQHNADRVLTELCNLGEEWFLVIQDDVEFCRRAIDRIAQIPLLIMRDRSQRTPIGAVSFYTPYAAAGKSPRSHWAYHPHRFYGELAVLWRRPAAQEFLRTSDPAQAHDLEIGRFFSEAKVRWRMVGHSPCLTQHTGVASARGAVTEGQQRVTMNYSAEHDAVRGAKRW